MPNKYIMTPFSRFVKRFLDEDAVDHNTREQRLFCTGIFTKQIVTFAQKRLVGLSTIVNRVDFYLLFCYNVYKPNKKIQIIFRKIVKYIKIKQDSDYSP